ncbi:hypothetical protein ACFE04_014573 [Oxalis oulophora]
MTLTKRPVQSLLNTVCNGTAGGARRSYGGAISEAASSSSSSSSSTPSHQLIGLEHQFSAHNYHPVPIVFSKAKGSSVWDPEGNKYLDFLAAYSAVNQGHCHPRITKALQDQVESLTLSSRAFYNDRFPVFAQRLTAMFGYDMVLPMNTGAEGVETALKLARKWGYEKKNIPKDEAIIVSCCGCFHGRTLAVISMSCDNEATRGFGPLLPGQLKVDFGDKDALEKIFKVGYKNIAEEHFVHLTVKQTSRKWILGKALGGGVIPVSAVLADKDVMLCIRPGEHGSTFGGNPLASAVAIASLDVLKDEKLAERSAELGEELRKQLVKIQEKFPNYIKEVRGRGLFNAIDFNHKYLSPASAYDICLKLKERGVLAKPTHGTIVRLTPPLTISMDEIQVASKALQDVLEFDLPEMLKGMAGKESNVAPPPTVCDRCGIKKNPPLIHGAFNGFIQIVHLPKYYFCLGDRFLTPPIGASNIDLTKDPCCIGYTRFNGLSRLF